MQFGAFKGKSSLVFGRCISKFFNSYVIYSIYIIPVDPKHISEMYSRYLASDSKEMKYKSS